MSIFKKKFFSLFTSGLDKLIFSVLNENLNGFIDEDACEQLVLILEDKSPKYTSQEALDSLLKHARKPMSWPAALRTLMVFHKLTHMHGNVLADFLVSNQLDNLAQFKSANTPLSKEALTMIPHYYKYIQKLSYNYDDLSICFFPDDEFSKKLKENNLSLLHFICKVQNMLGYLVGVLPLFEASLTQVEKTDLIRQISYFCLTDCYYYYTYISQTVTFMLNEIVKLNDQDAIFLFELYSDHIQMTKTLKASFQIKHQLKDFSLKIPDFYSIDLELNKKTETYIKQLKAGKPKAAPAEKKAGKGKGKPKFAANLEIEVEEEEQDTVPAINKQPLSSLQELSNVNIQITTPNFNKAVQKKELFKPPQPNKIATNILSPRIRVISPTGEIAEGNRLMELAQKNGSGRLGEYNPFNPFLPREIIVSKQNSEEVKEKPAEFGSEDLDQADQAAEVEPKAEAEIEDQVEKKVIVEEKNEGEDTEQGNNHNEEEETADNNGEEEDDYRVPCFASS